MWIPHGNYCQVAQGAAVEDLSEDVTYNHAWPWG